MRWNSNQRPERSPSSPAPFPAPLTSWHGKPPQSRSTRGRVAVLPTVRTSSCLSAFGQCLASTARQNGSISTWNRTGPRPARSRPRSRPPIPENSEPIVSNAAAAPTGRRVWPCSERMRGIPSRRAARLSRNQTPSRHRSAEACTWHSDPSRSAGMRRRSRQVDRTQARPRVGEGADEAV